MSEMWCDQEHQGMMDKVKDDLHTDVNCANPQDHESDAKRNGRKIKDWCRAALQCTGHATMPKVMIEALMHVTMQRSNMFPAEHGMSLHFSPSAIVGRRQLDCNEHCKCSFGELSLIHI